MSRKNRLPTSMIEIREILTRIVARDPDGAREASIAHIEHAARVALDVLARREIDAALPPARRARRTVSRKSD